MKGHREGGQRGTMTPGPMVFREPIGFRKVVGFSDSEEHFFFGDHPNLAGKTV